MSSISPRPPYMYNDMCMALDLLTAEFTIARQGMLKGVVVAIEG